MRKFDRTVGIAAPSFAVPAEAYASGIERLQKLGFEVRSGAHVFAGDGYLAGRDEEREADLTQHWLNPEIDLIWLARGGYGSSRLLESLPWRKFRARPKVLVGYSDATALFSAALRDPKQVCLHGPVVTELGDRRLWHAPSLFAALRREPILLKHRKNDVVFSGRAQGRLVGGNLTVLSHLCGTAYRPPLDEAILFLEDIGEEVYGLDRALVQLRQAGWLKNLRGVLLGHFGTRRRRRFPPDRRWDDVVAEILRPLKIPVIRGVQAGHVAAKRTLPLGWTATLDTAKRTILLQP